MTELGRVVSLLVVVVLVGENTCFDGNYSSKDEEFSAKFACRTRFNFASIFEDEGGSRGESSNCQVAGGLNQICGSNLHISYSVQEPYVTLRNGTVRGVIPGKRFSVRIERLRELSC